MSYLMIINLKIIDTAGQRVVSTEAEKNEKI
jgi:hypothetical protein